MGIGERRMAKFILNENQKINADNFEKICEQHGVDPKKTVFIFPGNPGHHGKNSTLFSNKSGGGLGVPAGELGDKGYPVLSLPTTGMVQGDKGKVDFLAENAIADIWRAIGAGYNVMLPVRKLGSQGKYFEEELNHVQGGWEPNFWGGYEPTGNTVLAAYYQKQLEDILAFQQGSGGIPKQFENAFLEGLNTRDKPVNETLSIVGAGNDQNDGKLEEVKLIERHQKSTIIDPWFQPGKSTHKQTKKEKGNNEDTKQPKSTQTEGKGGEYSIDEVNKVLKQSGINEPGISSWKEEEKTAGTRHTATTVFKFNENRPEDLDAFLQGAFKKEIEKAKESGIELKELEIDVPVYLQDPNNNHFVYVKTKLTVDTNAFNKWDSKTSKDLPGKLNVEIVDSGDGNHQMRGKLQDALTKVKGATYNESDRTNEVKQLGNKGFSAGYMIESISAKKILTYEDQAQQLQEFIVNPKITQKIASSKPDKQKELAEMRLKIQQGLNAYNNDKTNQKNKENLAQLWAEAKRCEHWIFHSIHQSTMSPALSEEERQALNPHQWLEMRQRLDGIKGMKTEFDELSKIITLKFTDPALAKKGRIEVNKYGDLNIIGEEDEQLAEAGLKAYLAAHPDNKELIVNGTNAALIKKLAEGKYAHLNLKVTIEGEEENKEEPKEETQKKATTLSKEQIKDEMDDIKGDEMKKEEEDIVNSSNINMGRD